jgi:transcriptional regulator with XRE-family HTH domain
MAGASRQKPEKLAAKLKYIRHQLELSQNGLIRLLDMEEELTQAQISAFERGIRIPSLIVLLRYARSIDVTVESLIDDKMRLASSKK